MKTKAAILKSLNQLLEIQHLAIPKLQKGQVLVKIAYSGLCHSQINEIRGLKGEDKFLPHTLGHEGSGVVLECGEGVTKVKPDDHVVLSWIKGKGLDVSGVVYERVNSGAISTFLTHAVIAENRLIPIPKQMPLREAALLGCAIPTGAGVVKHEMGIKEGESFAVFGVGGVGLSALLAAKLAKASPIIAIDVNEEKLQKAKEMGASHGINIKNCDPVTAIFDLTGGHGADFVFESAGKKEAMEKAFSSLKAPGGLCVLAGNLPKGQKIEIDPFDLIRGKRIIGTWGGKSNIDDDVKYYCDLFLRKEISFDGLITHEMPLEKINELVQELEAGKVGRGLIALTS